MDVSQYLEIFIDESSEHLQNLNTQILNLESDPGNMDTVNEIFRAAHSLKGMAGTMGYKRMQNLTHDMENVFQEVRSEKIHVDSSMIDLLFDCLSALDAYLENIKSSSDEGTEENEVIIKSLNDFISNANNGGGSPAPKEEAKAEAVTEVSDDKVKIADIELSEHEKKEIIEGVKNGKITDTDLKRCCANVLKAIFNSNIQKEYID